MPALNNKEDLHKHAGVCSEKSACKLEYAADVLKCVHAI